LLFKGRNLAGKVGLFPQSYTTAAPPSTFIPPPASNDTQLSQTPSTLQPLHEVSESSSPGGRSAANSHSKAPSQGDGEVMKATMTDVQKAIEQLGRNKGNGTRDDRSFSFASSRGDGDPDTDTDIDIDTDRETDAAGDDWHRDARVKLAEQARKVVEEQKRKDEENNLAVRNIAPPIEVEMSDESEGEDDDDGPHHPTGYAREHPHIPEEDEDEFEVKQTAAHAEPEQVHTTPGDIVVPVPDESQVPTATAQRTAFPDIVPVTEPSPDKAEHASATSLPTPTSPGSSSHAIPPFEPQTNGNVAPSLSVPDKTASQITPTPSIIRDAHMTLPSPAASSIGHQQASKHNSFASSNHTSSSLQPLAQDRPTSMEKKPTTHPSEWNMEEVVDWLRSKGFGDDVCDKFIGM
jgi:hypothetical protein